MPCGRRNGATLKEYVEEARGSTSDEKSLLHVEAERSGLRIRRGVRDGRPEPRYQADRDVPDEGSEFGPRAYRVYDREMREVNWENY